MEDKVRNASKNAVGSENKIEETDENPFNVKDVRVIYPRIVRYGPWIEDVKALGWFGRDVKGKYTRDPEVLEYLHIPKSPDVNFDLTLTHKDDEERTSGMNIDGIFRWVMEHYTDVNGKAKKIDTDFVTYRFDLQKLMCTPYEKMNGWEWQAIKVKGVIYTLLTVAEETDEMNEKSNSGTSSENDTERKCKDGDDKNTVDSVENEDSSSDQSESIDCENTVISGEDAEKSKLDVMSRYGCKFEHYLLSPSPDVPPNPDRPLRAFDDFAVAFSAKLGKYKLLYAGEMDGMPNAQAPKDLDNADFVELKTVKENMKEYNFKRYKLLQCWAQNVWMKVKYMLMGYRDDSVGVVRRLARYHLKDLPALANGLWNPHRCFAFVHRMLDLASVVLDKEKPGTQITFEWHPNMFGLDSLDMGVTIIPPYEGEGKPPEEFPMIDFIPDFYYKWLDENFDNEGNILEQPK